MSTKAASSSAPPPTTPAVEPRSTVAVEDDRTGMTDDALRRAFLDHLSYSLGKGTANSTALDRFVALALTVRDRLTYRWAQTQEQYSKSDVKRVYYLSAEFLLGRALANNLHALGLYDKARTLLRGAGSTSPTCSSTSRSRASATAASAAWPRASSTRWRRSAARLRLRHPLRVRHLRAGDQERLAGRAPRRVAALRQPVGDRPPRVRGAAWTSAGASRQ